MFVFASFILLFLLGTAWFCDDNVWACAGGDAWICADVWACAGGDFWVCGDDDDDDDAWACAGAGDCSFVFLPVKKKKGKAYK